MAIVVIKNAHMLQNDKQSQPGSWVPQRPAPNPILGSAVILPVPELI